jgi:hypothetical protein
VFHAESAATTQAWGGERHARWHASTYRWLARRRGLAYARLIATLNVVGYLARAGILSIRDKARGTTATRDARESAMNAARAHSVGLRSRGLLDRVR